MTRSVDLTAYDEDTMARVRGVLKGYIGEGQLVTDAINTLHNVGILFRERPYDEERKPLSPLTPLHPAVPTAVEIREKALAYARGMYSSGTPVSKLVEAAAEFEKYLQYGEKG